MNRQRAYGERLITPIERYPALPRPYGDYMPDTQQAVLINNTRLNRAPWWWDGSTVFAEAQNFRNENHSAPPDPWALAGIAKLLRNPTKYGLKAGGVHAFFDLEPRGDDLPIDLPQMLGAVRALRDGTAPSQKISVYAWPGGELPGGTPADRAELASLVTSLVYDAYNRREHARDPALWEAEARACAARWKREWPRRSSWIAYVQPRWAIYYDGWPDVEHLKGQLIGLEKWRYQDRVLREIGFTPLRWGMIDSLVPDPEVVPYLEMQ